MTRNSSDEAIYSSRLPHYLDFFFATLFFAVVAFFFAMIAFFVLLLSTSKIDDESPVRYSSAK